MVDNISGGKSAAIVGYLTIIGTVIALFMNNEKKNPIASFHIRQALGIFVTFHGLGYIIGSFDSWAVTLGLWVFIFVLWIFGIAAAAQGQIKPVPIVGEFYQKIFKNVQ